MTQIDTAADLDAVFAAPSALLFKNSMTCPISAAARQEMRLLVDKRPDTPLHVVDVNARADLSREIARRTGIEHDSPQVIVLAHGEPRWHASHYSIRAGEVAAELDAVTTAA
ncbi:MAG TPA: bacillithiol system redox-active protein YtxJ [Gemmatimonadaceae bacterium]|nr:bacillithiol system redox-active protein YtxJ [Gemmatimonadaceae bacterium]